VPGPIRVIRFDRRVPLVKIAFLRVGLYVAHLEHLIAAKDLLPSPNTLT
jgi:hypothetical protein